MEAVLGYLDKVDPEAARRARERYACFDQFGERPAGVRLRRRDRGLPTSCEREVVDAAPRAAAPRPPSTRAATAASADDEFFFAEQNARLVANAEEYYRTMFRGGVESWNLRDRHMVETLEALAAHPRAGRAGRAQVVVWAHNSHLGDARATEMGEARRAERRPAGARARTARRAARRLHDLRRHRDRGVRLGRPGERKHVRPALPGSYEELFHEAGVPRFLLDLQPACTGRRSLERAIGVVYRPETERSHYFHARLPSSSTRSSISTRRARSSRSNDHERGSEASCPRPTRRGV